MAIYEPPRSKATIVRPGWREDEDGSASAALLPLHEEGGGGCSKLEGLCVIGTAWEVAGLNGRPQKFYTIMNMRQSDGGGGVWPWVAEPQFG